MKIFEIFYFACNAILPIVLVVLLGYFLRRIKFFNDDFLNKANKLCFRVLIPILLFSNIAFIEKEAFSHINWSLIIYAIVAILLLFFIGLIIVKLFIKEDKQKGVILQCLFRSNYALIGIPLCEFLAPINIKAECVGLASIIAAVSIPLFNILAVISLSIFDKEANNKVDIKSILKKIAKNPLILGVLVGLIFLGLRMILINLGVDASTANISSNFTYKAIKNVAGLASPLALIVLGGQFKFSAVKKLAPQIILGTSLRTVFVPAISLIIAYLLGFRQLEFPALIALFATPVAVSSVPMAREMNQDGELAGQLVVWTSIFSILSLFVIVMICCGINIFVI